MTDNKRSVFPVKGVRQYDQSAFHGLKFRGPYHRPFFLTPGQVKTVLALKAEALEIIKNLPPLSQKGEVEMT